MNFDLNIENYKKNELLDMFNLSNVYDQNTLETCEKKLRDGIDRNQIITQETKNKTINFIVKAKQILLENLVQSPTTNISNNTNSKPLQLVADLYNTSYDMKQIPLENTTEHMVQVRQEKPYLSSYPTEFFPGIINPLKRKTNRQFLNIDTRFRENYYNSSSTNYTMTLPIIFNDVLSMQLLSLELPTSYYVISKQFGNNFFTLIVEGEDPVVIEIPNGNYTSAGILTYLNDKMTNLGGNFTYISFNINIDSNGDGSNQMVVNIDPVQNLSFSLNFQANNFGIDDRNTPLPLKLGWKLGFRNGIYENNVTYVSEGVVDLTGPRYMYLVIDDYNNNVNNSFYGAFNSSILNKNILARVTMNSPNFTIFSENNFNVVTYPRMYYGPVNIKNVAIQLVDEYGRVVDLNNMDFSFCLSFQTAYDI
jgi:hypothetical protein